MLREQIYSLWGFLKVNAAIISSIIAAWIRGIRTSHVIQIIICVFFSLEKDKRMLDSFSPENLQTYTLNCARLRWARQSDSRATVNHGALFNQAVLTKKTD